MNSKNANAPSETWESLNFSISSSHNHHIVEMSAWATMNNEQQLKGIKRFRSDKGREFLNEVTSTNGMRSVIRTPTAGEKNKLKENAQNVLEHLHQKED